MKKGVGYIEHEGKAVVTNGRFAHVMAIALDPRSKYTEGVIRCITSREGDVKVKGYVDRSVLHIVHGTSLDKFTIGEPLFIRNQTEMLSQLVSTDEDFIGLEDPDIWIDEETGLMHVYFTIPIKSSDNTKKIKTHLGHAVGTDLHSLEMTEPILIDTVLRSAKEVSIAPLNSKGFRYNLIESRDRTSGTTYSVVMTAVAQNMGGPWEYGGIAFHPADHNIPWIGGHASPGPLLPKSFIDIGENKLLGIINGREANQKIGTETKYGMFSIGLCIYDYELGKIDWVSKEPFIQDSEAVTITFASQFVETEPGKGILYAHVDDSFVRAYTLDATEMRKLLP